MSNQKETQKINISQNSQNPLFIDIDPNNPVTEIESLCMNCQKAGTSRILMTKIPFFKDIIIMSFSCPHCGYRNNEIEQSDGLAPQGIHFELTVKTESDMNRRVIKSTYQPVLNIKHIRQGVKIKKFNDIFSFYNNPSEENELEILLKDNKINLKNVKGEIEKIQNKKKDFKKRLNGFKEKYMIGQEENDEFIISSTTKTRLIVEFMFNPEYINVGGNVIINDQSLKAFGIITKIFK